jgi:outer membrane biosynthesis protein TonB
MGEEIQMKENFIAKKASVDTKKKADGIKSILISIILHILLFIILIVGLPTTSNKLPETKEIVVEIMQIKAKTNLAEKKSEENKKEPEKEVKTSNPIEKQPESNLETKPKDHSELNPIIIPPLKIEEPKKEIEKPKKEELKKPEPQPKEKKEIKKEKKQDIKKKEKKEPEKPSKQKKDNFDSLLKSLEKSVSKKKVENKSNNYTKDTNQETPKELSISLQDDIKRQLVSCWSPPAGAKDLKDLAVVIEIKLSPDGVVTEAKQVNSDLFNNNPYYKSAVNAATRAVWKCSPLKNLPKKSKMMI